MMFSAVAHAVANTQLPGRYPAAIEIEHVEADELAAAAG
jgi:hypothetical protein